MGWGWTASIIVSCLLFIVFAGVTMPALGIFIRGRSANSTPYFWCRNDWKCKAPPKAMINKFNAVNSVNGSGLGAQAAGGVYNPQDLYDESNTRCNNDGPKVVVNRVTGCLCKQTSNTSTNCSVSDIGNTAGCEASHCGTIPITCGEFALDTDNLVGWDGTAWLCPSPNSGTDGVRKFCSYMCNKEGSFGVPHSNDFFNEFIYKYKRKEP